MMKQGEFPSPFSEEFLNYLLLNCEAFGGFFNCEMIHFSWYTFTLSGLTLNYNGNSVVMEQAFVDHFCATVRRKMESEGWKVTLKNQALFITFPDHDEKVFIEEKELHRHVEAFLHTTKTKFR